MSKTPSFRELTASFGAWAELEFVAFVLEQASASYGTDEEETARKDGAAIDMVIQPIETHWTQRYALS